MIGGSDFKWRNNPFFPDGLGERPNAAAGKGFRVLQDLSNVFTTCENPRSQTIDAARKRCEKDPSSSSERLKTSMRVGMKTLVVSEVEPLHKFGGHMWGHFRKRIG